MGVAFLVIAATAKKSETMKVRQPVLVDETAKKSRTGRNDKSKIDLDGKTWLTYSISVWDDIRKTADEEKLKHPAMFPAQLCGRLIEVFSHAGDLVIDPFVGTGSTIVAAAERDRRAVGIDISQKFLTIAKHRIELASKTLFSSANEADFQLHKASATDLLKFVQPGSAALCITSPPYWDILTQKRTADGKEIRHYGNHKEDLGQIHDYGEFLAALKDVFGPVYEALKPGGYCCVVIMDLRKKDRFYPYHIDLTRMMTENLSLELDDIIIWNRAREYNNLRPLGHPYVFRVNKVHEFIMIYRKRAEQ